MAYVQPTTTEDAVLVCLRGKGRPMTTREILNECRFNGTPPSTGEVRRAIWRLVNMNQAKITPDWRVQST